MYPYLLVISSFLILSTLNVIEISSIGLSACPVFTEAILSITSKPSTILPKTVYSPSRCGTPPTVVYASTLSLGISIVVFIPSFSTSSLKEMASFWVAAGFDWSAINFSLTSE